MFVVLSLLLAGQMQAVAPATYWTIEDLATEADLIALGTIERVSTEHIQLLVDEPFLGAGTGHRVTVRTTTQAWPPIRDREVGARVFVFAERTPQGEWTPLGGGAGMFRVVQGVKGKGAYRDLRGCIFRRRRAGRALGQEELMSLPDLRGLVRRFVRD